MPIYHVNLGFADLADADLDAFTENVISKLTGNGAFAHPPVPPADMQLLLTEFTDAMAAADGGGKTQTITKNAARATLIAALRQDAIYVQANGNNDPATMLGSGYELSSLNRSQSPLPTPSILKITNGTSGQLTLRGTPNRNAKSYEVRKGTTPGVWDVATIIFTAARAMVVTGLTPGTNYTFSYRSVGGSTGYSDWSDPVSHMAT